VTNFDYTYLHGEHVKITENIEYMPPEYVGNIETETKPWSHDIWSFGTILIEIATGIPVNENCKSKIQLLQNKSTLGYGIFASNPKVRPSDGTVLMNKT
jgi:serine/threonine protein kinase